jgi:hypothetical protein
MGEQYTARLMRALEPTDKTDMPFTPEQIQELGARAESAGKQSSKERRALQRTPMGRQIKVVLKRETGPETIEAWFNDLSMQGLGLVVTAPLKEGDRIAVELGMPRQTLEYTVKRCSAMPGELYSVGCVRATAVAKAS